MVIVQFVTSLEIHLNYEDEQIKVTLNLTMKMSYIAAYQSVDVVAAFNFFFRVFFHLFSPCDPSSNTVLVLVRDMNIPEFGSRQV